MFPEYQKLMSKLQTTDHHFHELLERHHQLDKKITDLEKRPAEYGGELLAMKQEKLALKDKVYKILTKANNKPH